MKKHLSLFSAFIGGLLYEMGLNCNQIAMFINGGSMPVSVAKCDDSEWATHQCLTKTTHLKWLCDVFPLHGSVFSIGDILIVAGEAILSVALCFYLYKIGKLIEQKLCQK